MDNFKSRDASASKNPPVCPTARGDFNHWTLCLKNILAALDDKSDICHFWYTTAYFKPEKVRQKLCEQAKIFLSEIFICVLDIVLLPSW